MLLSQVSMEDGKRCANLMAFLNKGRWDLSASDAEELVRIKKWIHDLALEMAKDLKTSSPAPVVAKADVPPDTGFKVRSINLGSPTPKNKKKSRKK